MDMGLNKMPEVGCDTIRRLTIREQLTNEKKSLEDRLARVAEALEMMDKFPDFEKIHDTITKAGY